MQNSQLLGKYLAGSNYSLKQHLILQDQITALKLRLILQDQITALKQHLNCKYGKVLQTLLYQQNYVVF